MQLYANPRWSAKQIPIGASLAPRSQLRPRFTRVPSSKRVALIFIEHRRRSGSRGNTDVGAEAEVSVVVIIGRIPV